MVSSTDLKTIGSLLIAGFGGFLVGGAAWKLNYQKTPAVALLAVARSLPKWRWPHA